MRRQTNTVALLERARGMCDPPTWYQLAKQTGIKETTISRCRLHDKTLGDINAWKLAKFLGMDAKDVMAYMAEDRAQDQQTREFWERQLPRVLPAIAIALVLSSSTAKGALIAGGSIMANATSVTPAIYYAKYLLRAALSSLLAALGNWGHGRPRYALAA